MDNDTQELIQNYEERVAEQEEESRQRRMNRRSFHRYRVGNFGLIALIVTAFTGLLALLFALHFLGIYRLPFINNGTGKVTPTPLQSNTSTTSGSDLDIGVSGQAIENAMSTQGYTIMEVSPIEGRKNFIGAKSTSYVQYFTKQGKVEMALLNVRITSDSDTNTTTKNTVKLFANIVEPDSTDWVLTGFDYVVKNQGEDYFLQDNVNNLISVIRYERNEGINMFLLAYLLPDGAYDDTDPFEIRGDILVSF